MLDKLDGRRQNGIFGMVLENNGQMSRVAKQVWYHVAMTMLLHKIQ